MKASLQALSSILGSAGTGAAAELLKLGGGGALSLVLGAFVMSILGAGDDVDPKLVRRIERWTRRTWKDVQETKQQLKGLFELNSNELELLETLLEESRAGILREEQLLVALSKQQAAMGTAFVKSVEQIMNRLEGLDSALEHRATTDENLDPAPRVLGVPDRRGFVGRANDLEVVKAHLQGSAVRAVLISGMPGIGKSALAREVAHQLADSGEFPGGIVWLGAEEPDLRTLWMREDIGGWIAPGAKTEDRPAEAIRRLSSQSQGPVLIILDNVESWAEQQRPGPLPKGPHIRLLATSRVRSLGGTAFDHVELGILDDADARDLLERQAGREVEPGSADLLARLDGHALSLELAGAYLRAYSDQSAKDYLGELEQGDPEASVESGDVGYGGTSRQALDTMWRLGSDELHLAWCLAAAFADAPATDLLGDVCGLDKHARRTLARWSLIDLENVRDWRLWSMHRLIRDYGRTQTPSALRTQATDAMVSGCAKLIAFTAQKGLYWLYLVERPHIDRACVLGLAGDVSDPATVTELASFAGTSLNLAGLLDEARARHQEALEFAGRHLDPGHPSVALARSHLALTLLDLGRPGEARRELELALDSDLATYGENHPAVANRRSNLSQALLALGDVKAARQQIELSLQAAIATHGEEHEDVARRHSNLGSVLYESGNIVAAEHHVRRALEIGLSVLSPDHASIATRRSNLAMIQESLGNFESAKDELDSALQSALKNHGKEHPHVAIIRHNLAGLFEQLGDKDRAHEEASEALRIVRQLPEDATTRRLVEDRWGASEARRGGPP